MASTGEGSDFEQSLRLPKYRGEYCTVFMDESEVIVYGSGSDWYVQYSNVTNHLKGWRLWFSDRSKAELHASAVSSKPYTGRFGVDGR